LAPLRNLLPGVSHVPGTESNPMHREHANLPGERA
jgi:hypothetical protein